MESRKTVALIIPSEIIAKGLASILEDSGSFSVLEVFHDYSKTCETRLRGFDPDVVIIDPVILDDGPAVTEDVLRQYDGSVSLYDRQDELVRKLRNAIDTKLQDPAPEPVEGELSAREKEILVCVAKGMLNKEIADKLNLSIYTVITHRKNITRKTGIKTVAGLTVYALLNNLIDMSSVQ